MRSLLAIVLAPLWLPIVVGIAIAMEIAARYQRWRHRDPEYDLNADLRRALPVDEWVDGAEMMKRVLRQRNPGWWNQVGIGNLYLALDQMMKRGEAERRLREEDRRWVWRGVHTAASSRRTESSVRDGS